MIKRDCYLDLLKHSVCNGEIKVITGIRRDGKSVLLFELFYEYLLGQRVHDDEIIRISLNQIRRLQAASSPDSLPRK